MDNFENKILEKIDSYRKKRNFVRKIFQILFIGLFCFSVYVVYVIPKRNKVQIDIVQNYLINTSELQNAIYGYITDRNFFLISPRDLSEYLTHTYGLINNVIIRKYLLPKYKIVAFVHEKKIWGKLIYNDSASDNQEIYGFVAEDAKLISPNYLNIEFVPQTIPSISVDKEHLPVWGTLNNLRIFLESVNKNNSLNLRLINILPNEEVEMVFENELKVNVGKLLPEDLKKKSDRLLASLELIEKEEVPANYLNLGLDNSATLKSDKKEHKKEEKFKIRLFRKKARNE